LGDRYNTSHIRKFGKTFPANARLRDQPPTYLSDDLIAVPPSALSNGHAICVFSKVGKENQGYLPKAKARCRIFWLRAFERFST
jgi:hypothetical protein